MPPCRYATPLWRPSRPSGGQCDYTKVMYIHQRLRHTTQHTTATALVEHANRTGTADRPRVNIETGVADNPQSIELLHAMTAATPDVLQAALVYCLRISPLLYLLCRRVRSTGGRHPMWGRS